MKFRVIFLVYKEQGSIYRAKKPRFIANLRTTPDTKLDNSTDDNSSAKCAMQRWVLSLLKRTVVPEQGLQNSIATRALTTTPPKCAKKMPDRPKSPPEKEFTEAFLHGSGPGGQKIVRLASHFTPDPILYIVITISLPSLPSLNAHNSVPEANVHAIE